MASRARSVSIGICCAMFIHTSQYVPPKPEPSPIPGAKIDKPKSKGKGKETTTSIEVLNPKATATPDPDEDDEDNEPTLPTMTPTLTEFSKLPLWGYEASWEFVQSHRDVIAPGASDALLVAAFSAQSDGKGAYAKRCVHQSLLLQYCEKLGRDGVRLFFKK
jgi:cell division cycle protein 37